MTDEERYLQEEKEYEWLRTQPRSVRLKHLIKTIREDKDGSVKFNLMVFAIFAGAILLYILLERVF